MKKKQFESISMTGRLAYAILCFEAYLLRKHPERDFKPLSAMLWLGTSSMNWDDFYELMDDLSSEFLLVSTNYDPSNFSQLTAEEFNTICPLIKGIESETDPFFSILHDITSVYAYSTVPGQGKESIDILFKAIALLETNGIELPNVNLVAFSSFSERDGWGKRFDGRHLSLIAKHEN